jgi:site-specific DNA-methyltransferase (adenine-specific)
LPPADVLATLSRQKRRAAVTILDPWYNRGAGGVRDDYSQWLGELLAAAARCSDHVFLWGFPEIVAGALGAIPPGLTFVSWLTWYFKNCPSVIRGWRSAQQACLHFARPDAPMYPEHFLNEAQHDLKARGKLRYMPGPPSVIEAPLLIGFVGRDEQTGHPSQKPKSVIEPLLRMTAKRGDLVLDPMCGSGTTGAVCLDLGLDAILCDASAEYVELTARRLRIAPRARKAC